MQLTRMNTSSGLILLLVFISVGAHSLLANNCESYFNNLTNSVIDTYTCFSNYSQPLAICSRCSEKFSDFDIILSDTTTKNQFEILCSSFLAKKRLIQPWSEMISFLRKTWRSAYCNQCLSNNCPDRRHPRSSYSTIGLLPNYNLSAYNNVTLKVFDHLSATVGCVTGYILNTNVSFLDPVNFPTGSSIQVNRSVCRNCLMEYSKLIQSYEVWINEVSGLKQRSFLFPLEINSFTYSGLCIDVVDAVNRSHFVWSNILGCSISPTQKTGPTLLPLIICVVIGVAFHTALICFFHKPSHVVVYMQSRVEAATEPAQPTTTDGIVSTDNSLQHPSSLLRKTSFAPVARNISFDVLPQEFPLAQ